MPFLTHLHLVADSQLLTIAPAKAVCALEGPRRLARVPGDWTPGGFMPAWVTTRAGQDDPPAVALRDALVAVAGEAAGAGQP